MLPEGLAPDVLDTEGVLDLRPQKASLPYGTISSQPQPSVHSFCDRAEGEHFQGDHSLWKRIAVGGG